MTQHFTRNARNIKDIQKYPLWTNEQNDMMSDSEDIYIRNLGDYFPITQAILHLNGGQGINITQPSDKNTRTIGVDGAWFNDRVNQLIDDKLETLDTECKVKTNEFDIDIPFDNFLNANDLTNGRKYVEFLNIRDYLSNQSDVYPQNEVFSLYSNNLLEVKLIIDDSVYVIQALSERTDEIAKGLIYHTDKTRKDLYIYLPSQSYDSMINGVLELSEYDETKDVYIRIITRFTWIDFEPETEPPIIS